MEKKKEKSMLDWLKEKVSPDSTAGKLRDRGKKIDTTVEEAEGFTKKNPPAGETRDMEKDK